ncbi:hypothetical protein X777_16781 [Ooceraea biroi]|uniref:Uncharacterized protein n=1 Tax=Ooceraea biroi TaxID=2015173 RepID=A0A026WVF0_OOCBI|nr:hypothetical protein X777_16781 [Ooceraea biroi]
MLSPGQDAPPNNYSSGNVVLQGAPCSQCRDLCPAGYVPHFWRENEPRAALLAKSTSREDPKVFKFLSNSHARAATGSDILLPFSSSSNRRSETTARQFRTKITWLLQHKSCTLYVHLSKIAVIYWFK